MWFYAVRPLPHCRIDIRPNITTVGEMIGTLLVFYLFVFFISVGIGYTVDQTLDKHFDISLDPFYFAIGSLNLLLFALWCDITYYYLGDILEYCRLVVDWTVGYPHRGLRSRRLGSVF